MQTESQASILSDISDLEECTDSTPSQNQPHAKSLHDKDCSDDEFDMLVNQRNVKKN